GVVHDPTREELFSAVRGEGAFLNGERLGLRPGPELAEALVGTGFSYDSERRAAQGRLVSSVLPAVRDIRRAGAAAIDLCWVAAGRLDAFYESDLAPWDHAAGSLVVREAGGSAEELGGLLGGEPTLVAAAPGLGEHLAALLVAASGPPRGPDARPW
ncbi:MAG: inositol monophosphatase family protein, partial [Acidimicrobiales bacterium]